MPSSSGPAGAAPRPSAPSFRFPRSGRASCTTSFIRCLCRCSTCRAPGGMRSTWAPLAPGIELRAIKNAPAPARSAPQRLSQMRALTRDFSASTKDLSEKRLELRLLPQPLYRYESTDPDVLDGAIFAFVTSTDPEALLVIEARKPARADGPVWEYGLCRFTDLALVARHKGKEVFAAPLIPYDSPEQDPKHRFRVFHDRDIPAVEQAKTP